MLRELFLGLTVLTTVAVVGLWAGGGIHRVEEGHVGMYWRGGALLSTVTDPGFHAMVPFITTTANVQTTIQTDLVSNIPCGTSGGVIIYFQKIEVVNRLRKESAFSTVKLYGINYDRLWIFDKIHSESASVSSFVSVPQTHIFSRHSQPVLQQGIFF